jgi:hypothetical protein
MSTFENDGESSESRDDSARTSRPELVVGTLGGLLVLAAFAFLVYQAVAVRQSGPELHAGVSGIDAGAGQYVGARRGGE